MTTLNISDDAFKQIDNDLLFPINRSTHPVKILILYGSLRKKSYSRLVAQEARRILIKFGAEVKLYNPTDLPLVDEENSSHSKVLELHELVKWSEGMVWSSPERHGSMTGVMKTQIDWVPLSDGAVRPTQGKTLALMQVNGGSQSFNTVNQLRILGRWMRMLTIPNQSSTPKAWKEFDDNGRMKPSGNHNRIVDVMEELVKFTLITRDIKQNLVDRYSERVETAEELMERVKKDK